MQAQNEPCKPDNGCKGSNHVSLHCRFCYKELGGQRLVPEHMVGFVKFDGPFSLAAVATSVIGRHC